MHEHWHDVPGDIAGEAHVDNLPGGFGVDDPDRDVDTTLEDYFPHRILHGTDRHHNGRKAMIRSRRTPRQRTKAQR